MVADQSYRLRSQRRCVVTPVREAIRQPHVNEHPARRVRDDSKLQGNSDRFIKARTLALICVRKKGKTSAAPSVLETEKKRCEDNLLYSRHKPWLCIRNVPALKYTLD